MAIVDYASLQTAIAAWLHRTDTVASGGSVPITDFISLAEAKLNGDLDSRAQEVRTTLTCVPTGDLTGRLVALPSDMLEMRRLMVVDSDPATVLEYKSPDQLAADNSYLLSQAKPNSFTVIGTNIELSPPPDATYPLELIYQQRIPALSISNTTNWLLTVCPNAYLFGSLMESVAFTQDEARLGVWQKKYDEAVQSVNSIDWYSGSTMRVRAR